MANSSQGSSGPSQIYNHTMTSLISRRHGGELWRFTGAVALAVRYVLSWTITQRGFSPAIAAPAKNWSGSDYAISVAIDADKVMSYTGETRTYSRTGDSGKDAHYQFCPNCGTTVRWTIDIAPLRSFFAGGAFDDIANLDLMAQMYADSSAPWVDLDCAITQPGPPDDPFRQAMIKEALSRR